MNTEYHKCLSYLHSSEQSTIYDLILSRLPLLGAVAGIFRRLSQSPADNDLIHFRYREYNRYLRTKYLYMYDTLYHYLSLLSASSQSDKYPLPFFHHSPYSWPRWPPSLLIMALPYVFFTYSRLLARRAGCGCGQLVKVFHGSEPLHERQW